MGRNSANILAFGWLITVLGVVGLGLSITLDLPASLEDSGFTSGKCLTGKSYYRSSDLTRAEKKQFSSNASAYQLIGSSGKKYRLIVDYMISGVSRDRLETRTYVTTDEFSDNTKLSLLLNGATQSEWPAENGQAYLYASKDLQLDSNQASYSVSLYQGENCEFLTDQLLSIDKNGEYGKPMSNWTENGRVLANYQNPNLKISQGDNFLSFEDWTYLGSLLENGVKIQYFSPGKNKWLEVSAGNAIAYPGRVYKISNSSKKTLTIQTPAFRVPDDLNVSVLQKGWNLIDVDEDGAEEIKFSINPDPLNLTNEEQLTLRQLLERGLVDEAYRVEGDDRQKVQLDKADFKQGRYWIRLNNDSTANLKMPNLVLSIDGAGDSFSTNQVSLKLSVENKDTSSHYIVSSRLTDPCQIGIKIKDKNDKVVYDSYAARQCPLWPSLQELKVNEKKDYNYLWEAPKGIKGDYILEAYFNYSRLPGNKISKTSSISFK